MTQRQGNLSINSENMLPIIKKWLYSDHDIFVREVISNACDAISKLHKLEIMGEYQYPDDHKDSIHVTVDPDAKTLPYYGIWNETESKNTSPRSHFREQPHSSKSTRTRRTRMTSSDISALDSIPYSWFPRMSKSTP